MSPKDIVVNGKTVMCMARYLSQYVQRKNDLRGLKPGLSIEDFWVSYHEMNDRRLGMELVQEIEEMSAFIDASFTQAEAKRAREAIRKRIARITGRVGVTVTLTDQAHKMLRDFAAVDNLTLSEVIVQRLGRQHRYLAEKEK